MASWSVCFLLRVWYEKQTVAETQGCFAASYLDGQVAEVRSMEPEKSRVQENMTTSFVLLRKCIVMEEIKHWRNLKMREVLKKVKKNNE